MKKIMKKIVMVAMTFCMCVSIFLLSGCGNKAASGDKDVVNLKFAYWGGTLEKQSVEALIKKFNEEHKNINVTSQQIPYGNYMEKLNTQASTNNLPDIGYMMEPNAAEWAESGKLRDLSELYEAGGSFENKIKESIYQFEENGIIIGSSTSIGTLTLLYNKKYFEENGIELPPYKAEDAWSWDEFVNILTQLTVDRNGKHPNESGFDPKNIKTYGINNFAGLTYETLMRSNGGGVVSEDGKQILIGTDKSIDTLQKIQDLMYKYYVMPKPSQASTIPSADTAMLTNRVAMSLTGSWDLQTLAPAVEKKGLELGVGVLPNLGNGVKTMNYGPPNVVFNNENTKEHWKEAQTFLEYFMDTEEMLPVVNSGLWQPNQEDWYKEPDKISKWTSNDFSPEHMKESLVDSTINNLTRNKAFYCKDANSIDQIITPALEQIWTGKKEARKVVEEDILPKLKKQFGDSYEFVE